MSSTGPVRLQSGDPLAELLAVPPELLDLTLDQFRILVVVHKTGTALLAARALGREQSSVQKQLNNLNDTAQRLIGESLVIKQGRGEPFLFSPSGDEAVALAENTLASWSGGIHRARRRVGTTITVGTTEFTIRFLGENWPAIQQDFEGREVELKISHVRTRDFCAKLDAQQVDLICGSFATERDQLPTLDYDFIEWHREGVALLANLTTRELPDKPVT
ncbi:LysR family transcriptional regulator [Amycolatopsis anabasis]|uniref:LysR family transcriptional regulator n=1 Tax=Amycolatopsis anabasis TaxID=1840409 RepID=UPI001C554B3B|nr:LysR family transcriptional regulator [Amycolatopsis anabasis]